MWFAISAGLQLAGALGSYSADKAQAKAAAAMQEYRNKMANISNAINQNVITTNTTMAMQASAKKAVYMRKEEVQAVGAATVSAAAAGVRGRSVNSTIMDIQRNAALVEKQRADDLQAQFLESDAQRMQSSLSAAMQQDYSYIPKPKLGSYLMSAAASTIQTGFQTGYFKA